MKSEKSEIVRKAKDLVLKAKNKKIIKSHTVAFEEFPVEKEIHKGRANDYR